MLILNYYEFPFAARVTVLCYSCLDKGLVFAMPSSALFASLVLDMMKVSQVDHCQDHTEHCL